MLHFSVDLRPLFRPDFIHLTAIAFQFLDPGPLLDQELELVPFHSRWIDLVLQAASHPLTRRYAPADAAVSRSQLQGMLHAWPDGRQPADPARGVVPAYHFWMKTSVPEERRSFFSNSVSERIAIAGGIGLRIGHSPDIELYYGHIGYHVYPPSRGHHYAERSCRLLLPLARLHDVNPLWITTNPDNHASRRTCERLGAELVEILDVPSGHPLYLRGERQKCRYRIEL